MGPRAEDARFDPAAIRFVLDGEVHVVGGIAPTTTVLQYLREHLHRTGTKEGCAEGDCGACTVVVASLHGGELRYRASNACIQFLPTLDGKALLTVESLKAANGGAMHPVQRAMVECHGSQCGFCTPGFVMSLFALGRAQAAPGDDDLRFALAGNLCRCTGYRPILAAARRMYEMPGGMSADYERTLRAGLAAVRVTREKRLETPYGRYAAPITEDALAGLVAERPQATLLAGGTDVGLWVTKQQRELADVIYLGNVEGLARIERTAQAMEIGAAVTLTDAFAALLEEYPDLREIVRRFASPPICNAGTLCGNIANGSPIGDSMPALIALGATLVLRRGERTRTLALEDFYLDYRRTALAQGEYVAAVRVPRARAALAFRSYKIAKRYDQDISGVCAAFAVELARRRIVSARVCFGAMAAVPKRAARCEAALSGAPWNTATIEKAVQALAADYDPLTDLRASADYRTRVAANLLRRFHAELSRAAGHGALWSADDGATALGATAPASCTWSAPAAAPRAVGAGQPHESAHLHVSGEALYTDDIAVPAGTLHAAVGTSEKAHARIRSLDLMQVRAAPGVVAVLTAADIPGQNNHGPVVHDDPIFATDLVEYAGQSLFAVVATSTEAARKAARLARIDYEELPAILDVPTALAQRSFVLPTRTLKRGDPDARLQTAPHRLRGAFAIGGQDHFYLEGQIALALPGEDGTMHVSSSTQHPSEVQRLIAHCLGLKDHDVLVTCRRMGGGFGGKETQPALFACIAALAARMTGMPVKLRVDRDADMQITGKRHPFDVSYDVGFDADGRILGVRLTMASNCGRSADLSDAVNARAMFHGDNCYYLADVEIVSHRCKTHQPSHTAFRGFGGPQGMLLIEGVMEDIARMLGKDPLEVRRANYYAEKERNVTPYGMTVEDNIIAPLVDELVTRSDYAQRRRAVAAFNASSPVLKRGLALTPVKFGIAFTATHMNQAGALLHVYTDGTILLNHGGTEMGQGLHTKVAQVVAEELQVDLAQIRCSTTDTSKVPNTSATAASSSSDLNGKAAQAAARAIKARLTEYAAARYKVAPEAVHFEAGRVRIGTVADLSFAGLVWDAYVARVSLSATGYYATPKIHYDKDTLTGRPFFYFAYGAAVSEVMVDTMTGESRLLRVDILHDVGESLNPAIDMGQVEGGFMQGVGWLTSEELKWDEAGRLATHAPSTYKIPTAHDWPASFNVALLGWGRNAEDTIYRSKAVGEPPLMLAMSVFHAIRDAVASLAPGALPQLDAPATPEHILRAIEALRATQDARVTARQTV